MSICTNIHTTCSLMNHFKFYKNVCKVFINRLELYKHVHTKCSSSLFQILQILQNVPQVCASRDLGPRPPSTLALNCLIKVCSGFQVDYLLCDDYENENERKELNKLGQIYVKWYISRHKFKICLSVLSWKETYCTTYWTKYTLCIASIFYYCWLTSSYLSRFSSCFGHPQMFQRWWLLTMMKLTVLLTCFYPWYSWRGFGKVQGCALFKYLPALGILNSSMPPTLPRKPTKIYLLSIILMENSSLIVFSWENGRKSKEYAGEILTCFFACDS